MSISRSSILDVIGPFYGTLAAEKPPSTIVYDPGVATGRVVVCFNGDTFSARSLRAVWNRYLRPRGGKKTQVILSPSVSSALEWNSKSSLQVARADVESLRSTIGLEVADLQMRVADAAKSLGVVSGPSSSGKKLVSFNSIQELDRRQKDLDILKSQLGVAELSLDKLTWFLGACPKGKTTSVPVRTTAQVGVAIEVYGVPSELEIKNLRDLYNQKAKEISKPWLELFALAPEEAVSMDFAASDAEKEARWKYKYHGIPEDRAKPLTSWYSLYAKRQVRDMPSAVRPVWAWFELCCSMNASLQEGSKIPIPKGLHPPRLDKPSGDARAASKVKSLEQQVSDLANVLKKAIEGLPNSTPAKVNSPKGKVNALTPDWDFDPLESALAEYAKAGIPTGAWVKEYNPSKKILVAAFASKQSGGKYAPVLVSTLHQAKVAVPASPFWADCWNWTAKLVSLVLNDSPTSHDAALLLLPKYYGEGAKIFGNRRIMEVNFPWETPNDEAGDYSEEQPSGYVIYSRSTGKMLLWPVVVAMSGIGLFTSDKWSIQLDDEWSVKQHANADGTEWPLDGVGLTCSEAAKSLGLLKHALSRTVPDEPRPVKQDEFVQGSSKPVPSWVQVFKTELEQVRLERASDFGALSIIDAVSRLLDEGNHFSHIREARTTLRVELDQHDMDEEEDALTENEALDDEEMAKLRQSSDPGPVKEKDPVVQKDDKIAEVINLHGVEYHLLLDSDLVDTPAGTTLTCVIRDGACYAAGLSPAPLADTKTVQSPLWGTTTVRLFYGGPWKKVTGVPSGKPEGKPNDRPATPVEEIVSPQLSGETEPKPKSKGKAKDKGKQRAIEPAAGLPVKEKAKADDSVPPALPKAKKTLREKFPILPGRSESTQSAACVCAAYPCKHTKQDVQAAYKAADLVVEKEAGVKSTDWTTPEANWPAKSKGEDPLKKQNPADVRDTPVNFHGDRCTQEQLASLRGALGLSSDPLPDGYKDMDRKTRVAELKKRRIPRWATAAVSRDPANLDRIRDGSLNAASKVQGTPRRKRSSDATPGESKPSSEVSTPGEKWRALKEKFADAKLWYNPQTGREKAFKSAFDKLAKEVGDPGRAALPKLKKRPRGLPDQTPSASPAPLDPLGGPLAALLQIAKAFGEINRAMQGGK
jgi:hypothetical protein